VPVHRIYQLGEVIRSVAKLNSIIDERVELDC